MDQNLFGSSPDFVQEQLRQSEERYQRMVAEIQDYAIFLLSKEGIIQNWNSGAAMLKGYRAEEIIGRSFSLFYDFPDLQRNLPQTLLHTAKHEGRVENEGWRVRKDGTRFWASVVITALHDQQGEVIGFSKITRDLTERKKGEDLLRQHARDLEEKNKLLAMLNDDLSSFSYIVAHDLKEPIRKIQIFASLQRIGNRSLSEVQAYAQKIEASAVRMQKLMDDLIAYSALTHEHNLDRVDLNEVYQAVKMDLELLIQEKQATLQADTLPVVPGIPHQLHQLFLNLISNSLKFAKPGVPPVITIRHQRVTGKSFSDESSIGHKLYDEIIVSDNGVGFMPSQAEKIFDVFHKLNPKHESPGSGIGLAIVKKVVTHHRGYIRAVGVPDEGASFIIDLPTL